MLTFRISVFRCQFFKKVIIYTFYPNTGSLVQKLSYNNFKINLAKLKNVQLVITKLDISEQDSLDCHQDTWTHLRNLGNFVWQPIPCKGNKREMLLGLVLIFVICGMNPLCRYSLLCLSEDGSWTIVRRITIKTKLRPSHQPCNKQAEMAGQ